LGRGRGRRGEEEGGGSGKRFSFLCQQSEGGATSKKGLTLVAEDRDLEVGKNEDEEIADEV